MASDESTSTPTGDPSHVEPPSFPTAVDIPSRFRVPGEIRPYTTLQRAGLTLAKPLLWALIAGLGIAAFYWLWFSPMAPPPPDSYTEEKIALYRQAVELHGVLQQQVVDSISGFFDVVVLNGVLPLLATIVGYILGTREGSTSSSDSGDSSFSSPS